MQFENYIEKELIEKLNKFSHVINDIQVGFANITFAYDNPELLRLLTVRGGLITQGVFDQRLTAVNKMLQNLKEKEADKLIRPVTAFLTFNTQEGYERALKYWGPEAEDKKLITENHKICDTRIKVEPAPEPSNIIWENRHITDREQNRNKCFVTLGILFLLLIAFVIFAVAKIFVTRIQAKYPPTFDCSDVDSQFAANITQYKEYANYDKPYTDEQQGTGIYLCYCKKYFSSLNFFNKDELCDNYQRSYQYGLVLTNVVAYGIVIFNIIIRFANIFLIKKIGLHTESEQTSAIFVAIFISTFLNTGLLILLTGANTSHTFLSWLPLRGSYTDLTPNWYLDIGPALTKTMFINSIYPYIDFCIGFGPKLLFRLKDSCFQNKTKCLTIQQYVNLYAGPEYLMHFKYAAILNTVWVTFMFGLALPMLFPIAAFTFFNNYVVERLLLTYYYKKPPMYDEKLNNTALAWAKYAPILMMAFGYWIMGNKQIFQNVIVPL